MADGVPQIWDIPLTPAQRWALVQLAFAKEAPQISDHSAGKKLRRALRAFGLLVIRDALRANENQISEEQTASSTPRLHKITAENLECVLGWSTVPRHTSIEMDAGEVFDLLEGIKLAPAEYGSPALEVFDPAAEDWKPPADPDPFLVNCPICKQRFDMSELGTPRQT